MQRVGIVEGARKVVRALARVKSGEKVAVVTDTETMTVAEALAIAAIEITPEVVTTIMKPVVVDGGEPPAIVAAALLAADVALLPLEGSISHSTATRKALEHGTRVLSLPGATPDQLVRGGVEADFETASPRVRRMAELLGKASGAHLTTPAGTDCRFTLSGRPGNAHDCLLDRPGKFSAFPNVEANTSPVDGSAEGVIVFDGSIPNLRIGALRTPVTCTVRKGNIVKVEGGPEAEMIRKVWAEMGDATVYNIAQLAIGLNPCIYMLTGVWGQDHGAFGTVHIGIGTSANLGGTTKAACHFDGMMYRPTLRLDDQTVLENGEVKI